MIHHVVDDWEAGGTDFSFDRSPDDEDARIDLSGIESRSDAELLSLRKKVGAVLAPSLRRTRYRIADCGSDASLDSDPRPISFRHTQTVILNGGDLARVVLFHPRFSREDREDRVTHKILRERDAAKLSGLFGPRGRPYGEGHLVLGNDKLPHKMTKEAAEFFLAAMIMLGEKYEGFFNGVAPGGPERLHAQYLYRKTSIFEASNWPVPIERCAGELGAVAHWMSKRSAVHENLCDFVFRCFGVNLLSICFPRQRGKRKPSNGWFGNFGALEMAGYLLSVNADAFVTIVGNPLLYEEALKEAAGTA